MRSVVVSMAALRSDALESLGVTANELIVASEIPFRIGRAAELPSSLRRTRGASVVADKRREVVASALRALTSAARAEALSSASRWILRVAAPHKKAR